MRIDPYKHEERYLKWIKEVDKKGIPGISKINSNLILRYLRDMDNGINIANKSKKGSRSYTRLNTLREKMVFFSKKFKEEYGLDDITKVSEENLTLFFSKMRKGTISRQDGKKYRSVNYFVKVFKAFWHWHMKVNRKNGEKIADITEDLDSRSEKPEWVYFTEEEFNEMIKKASVDLKPILILAFTTGARPLPRNWEINPPVPSNQMSNEKLIEMEKRIRWYLEEGKKFEEYPVFSLARIEVQKEELAKAVLALKSIYLLSFNFRSQKEEDEKRGDIEKAKARLSKMEMGLDPDASQEEYEKLYAYIEREENKFK